MSGVGRPDGAQQSSAELSGIRLAVVTAQWHTDVCDQLRMRALAAAAETGAVIVHDLRAPGALELPVIAQACAQTGLVDAVVVLGAVIRGGTPHFDYVCSTVSQTLGNLALAVGMPIANGVLTCDTREQALARAGFEQSAEDKGFEAAMAAISTAATLRTLRHSRSGSR